MSTPLPFGSVFVALPTLFDERGRVDDVAIDHLVDYLILREVEGIALLTEAGEDPLLAPEERRALVDLVGARVEQKKKLLVSVSSGSTREAIDLARHAAKKGGAGILVAPLGIPGFGYRELYRHIDRIAHATPLPTYLVVRPHNAADRLAPEELAALGKHPGLAGVFVPGASAAQISAWAKRMKPKDGTVFTGCSLSFSTAARAGAKAAICGLAMLATDHAVRYMAAVRAADVDGARGMEKLFAPAVEMLGPPEAPQDHGGVKRLATKIAQRPLEGGLLPWVPFAHVKEGLKLQGHPVKPFVRPPYEPIAADQVERLRLVLKSSGLIS